MTYLSKNTLQVRNLRCERSDRILFNELSFDLSSEQILYVQGSNGSGKSSLLRILSGLLLPSAGEIFWNDQSIDKAASYTQDMIYMGHSLALHPNLTARENLSFAMALAGYTDDKVEKALDAVDLLPFADVYAGRLSAGQQRRIGLARLFIQEAKLWILDEPGTALDDLGHGCLSHLFHHHLSRGGTCVVAIHHEMKIEGGKERRLQLQGRGVFTLE
jgi:heme exporter protein A